MKHPVVSIVVLTGMITMVAELWATFAKWPSSQAPVHPPGALNFSPCDRCERSLPRVRVLAIMACYNEGDVLMYTVERLLAEGIHVHVVDNWSTDGSWEVIKRAAEADGRVTVERFPDSPVASYQWRFILKRKEEIASMRSSEFDWFMHHDPDEIRESPWSDCSLAEAISFVHALGYNSINFRVFTFPLMPWVTGHDNPFKSMRCYKPVWYQGDAMQIKAWASTGNVEISTTGGHLISIPDQRVFPVRFVMRHYPLRSRSHAIRKVLYERKARWDPVERQMEWHFQYEEFNASHVPVSTMREVRCLPHSFQKVDIAEVEPCKFLVPLLVDQV